VRRIEAENFRLAFPCARVLLAPIAERSTAALIAVDSDDLVVGATRSARLALGLTPEFLAKPLPAASVLGPGTAAEDLTEAERGVLQRALARADGNVTSAALNLRISRATMHRKLNRFGIKRQH